MLWGCECDSIQVSGILSCALVRLLQYRARRAVAQAETPGVAERQERLIARPARLLIVNRNPSKIIPSLQTFGASSEVQDSYSLTVGALSICTHSCSSIQSLWVHCHSLRVTFLGVVIALEILVQAANFTATVSGLNLFYYFKQPWTPAT